MLYRQIVGIRIGDDADAWVLRPEPRRKHYRADGRFCRAWWNINDEVVGFLLTTDDGLCEGLEFVAQQRNVPVVHRCFFDDDVPKRLHELEKRVFTGFPLNGNQQAIGYVDISSQFFGRLIGVVFFRLR